jgi:hypothetical protein
MNDDIQPKSREDNDVRLSETVAGSHKEKNRLVEFIKDFITGFGALAVIGIILFVVIPVLLLIFKVSVALIIPISLFGALIILVAMFGKLLRHLFKS